MVVVAPIWYTSLMPSGEFTGDTWFRALVIPLCAVGVHVVLSIFPLKSTEEGGFERIGCKHFRSVGLGLVLGALAADFAFLIAPPGAQEAKKVSLFVVSFLAVVLTGIVAVVLYTNLSRRTWQQVTATSFVGIVAMFVVWGIWSI